MLAVDQTGDNKEVRRPPVGLWSSEQAANLGDRPQTVARGEELHFTQISLQPLVSHLWLAVSLKRVREGTGGWAAMGGDGAGNDISKQLWPGPGWLYGSVLLTPHYNHFLILVCQGQQREQGWALSHPPLIETVRLQLQRTRLVPDLPTVLHEFIAVGI